MSTLRYILVSAICVALLLGQWSVATVVQAFPTLANNEVVEDGAKVTVWFKITPSDNPTTIYYRGIEQFVQGQHTIPPGIEQRIAGMHPGESKAFRLSAEEGFGPYDNTKLQTISPSDLPLDAREGDTVGDGTGTTARIIRILPEKAVLDLNHPLAGKQLMVALEIVKIENPDEGATIYEPVHQAMGGALPPSQQPPIFPSRTGKGECSYGVYGKILCEVQREVIKERPVASGDGFS